MTPEKFFKVLDECAEVIDRFEHGAAVRCDAGSTLVSFKDRLGHLLWMVNEVKTQEQEKGKANRWLGFVQGAMWMAGIASIDQLRKINISNEPEAQGQAVHDVLISNEPD